MAYPYDIMKFLVRKDGKQIGPFTATQIDEYINKGILCPTDYGWHAGLDQWVELHEIDGVKCREISEQEAMDILEQQTMESQQERKRRRKLKSIIEIITVIAVLSALPLYVLLKNDTAQKPDWSVEIEGYNLRRWDCYECQAKVSSLEFDCPKCGAAIDFSDQQPNESDAEFKERVEWEEKALGNDR